MLLPKRLTPDSQINLVHTSSPVGRSDLHGFEAAVKRLTKSYPKTKVYDVERHELDPRYLAASERERLKQFRAASKNANWLLPIYGGTGCGDIVRHLSEEDLKVIKKQAPIVNGFSDTTFLINHLYFEIDLLTFHYANAGGIFSHDNHQLFFDVIEGRTQNFSFNEPGSRWLTCPPPTKPIEGIAIGGNLETFRDMLDVCRYGSASWKPFILFMEDVDLDAEDFHRIVIALDQRRVFRQLRAIVIGRMDDKDYASAERKYDQIFGQPPAPAVPGAAPAANPAPVTPNAANCGEFTTESAPHYIQYLLSEVLEDRIESNDPLPVLMVTNFGHGVTKNPLLIPIGGKTIIKPDASIEFVGPFVQ
ncbi:MAG: LD-carboxypeptidase [Patescibacteria group bacterium]|jgi:muramoyltetrapeptide carboxypeptidase LdcA involved in peptidoglycan recycling